MTYSSMINVSAYTTPKMKQNSRGSKPAAWGKARLSEYGGASLLDHAISRIVVRIGVKQHSDGVVFKFVIRYAAQDLPSGISFEQPLFGTHLEYLWWFRCHP